MNRSVLYLSDHGSGRKSESRTDGDGSQTAQDQAGGHSSFFISYNEQRGKKFKVTGTGGPKKAIKFLRAGMQAHKKARKK